MSSPSNVLEMDVRILRQGQLDASFVRNFGAQQLADITHLPAGATSDRIANVTVPPGGQSAAYPASSAETLLHVVTGQVRLLWGSESEHTTIASPGDTALVPAATAFQVFNASPVEVLQFILVRGN